MAYKDKEKEQKNKKEYYQKNKEKFRLLDRKWRKKNPERASAICKKYRDANKKKRYITCKKWRTNNLGKIQEQFRNNPKARIDRSIKSLIWLALKGKKAGQKWQKLVGYTLEDLIKHLEKQFVPEMTWDNYGSYTIDYNKPFAIMKVYAIQRPQKSKGICSAICSKS